MMFFFCIAGYAGDDDDQENTGLYSGGYKGKKNELAFDLFSPISGNFSLEYKRTFSAYFAVLLKGGIGYHNKQLGTIKPDLSTNENKNENNNKSGNSNLNTKTIGASILYGYWHTTGMPMPLGFYTGLGYEKTFGTLKQERQTDDNEAIKICDYKVRRNHIGLKYGKNTILTDHLTLDINLEFVFEWGNYIPQNTVKRPVIMRNILWVYQYEKSINNSITINNRKFTYTLVRFFPNINISYLF